jgi:hypothetical protein
MIQSVQEQEITLSSNTAPITFADTDLRTASANCFNGWLNHNEGSAQFNLVAGGIYEIDFNANVTSATPGMVGLGIYADGVKLNGAEADTIVGTAGEFTNVSMNKYIRVCGRGSVTITINSVPTITYSGGGTPVVTDTEIPIIKNANISIKRYA